MKRPQSTQIQQQHSTVSPLSLLTLSCSYNNTPTIRCLCSSTTTAQNTTVPLQFLPFVCIPESSSECQSSTTPQDCVEDPDSVTLDQTWLSGRFSRIMRTTAVVRHPHLPLPCWNTEALPAVPKSLRRALHHQHRHNNTPLELRSLS